MKTILLKIGKWYRFEAVESKRNMIEFPFFPPMSLLGPTDKAVIKETDMVPTIIRFYPTGTYTKEGYEIWECD